MCCAKNDKNGIALRRYFLLVWMALSVAVTACGTPTPAPQVGTTLDPPQVVPDFTLVNQDGASASLSDLRGKPLLFAFAYTHCPDICPVTVADFMRVKRTLGSEGNSANFAMISVDGERDSPTVLKNYLKSFDTSFIGLTGAPDLVAQIGEPYGLKVQFNKTNATQAAYLVNHTSFIYLLDGYGRWRKTYAFQTSPEAIAADIRTILREPAPVQGSGESLSAYYANPKPKAIYMMSPVVMPDFTFTTQHNQPFQFSSLRGKWALMYFGTSECTRNDCPPDVLAQWREVKARLGEQAHHLAFILLSVDANYDTPAVLKPYVERYDKDFIALTAPNGQISPVAVKYGVHIANIENTQPTRYVPHSVYSVLVNPQGKWVIAFPFKMTAEDIASELRSVLSGAKSTGFMKRVT
jgi:protein SCO1/2